MQFAHLVDISERTFQDNDLFLVKFGPNNKIKTTSISFTTVHFIFYPLFQNDFANQSQGRSHKVHNF